MFKFLSDIKNLQTNFKAFLDRETLLTGMNTQHCDQIKALVNDINAINRDIASMNRHIQDIKSDINTLRESKADVADAKESPKTDSTPESGGVSVPLPPTS